VDIFISYRRANSGFAANFVYDKLIDAGYSVFLDVKTLGSGKFDIELRREIECCKDFLLILAQDSFERCRARDDWFRIEIELALKNNKNIIPIMIGEFKFPDEMPNGLEEIAKFNAVIMHSNYESESIQKIKKYLKSKPIATKILKPVIKVATSNLTVVDAINQSWDCKKILNSFGFEVEEYKYEWSNKILDDLNETKLDLAIYNKQETIKFNKINGNRITILRDLCSSMGGRNFYILATKAGRWKNMNLEDFKNTIGQDTIISVSKSSDMYKNLLYILDMNESELLEKGVKIVDYKTTPNLAIFEFNPDLLLIAGQDIRFLAEYRGNFIEVLGYDDFPKDKRDFFYNNSINSLLISESGIKKLRNIDMKKFTLELISNFYKNLSTTDKASKIYARLSQNLSGLCENDIESEYIIKKIIFETYRLF